jgi:maltose alpha-D-glucosyltransferase / alpha-amylase
LPASDPLKYMNNPLWYKDAVIYELHVKTFYDSDGDGIGDFRGLLEKMPYFEELGITAIWLLPFYPSPLRDDGYDIANYLSVNPTFGTLDDFRAVLEDAHRRGLRVITELVLNHTSDQHPWFQAARRAPAGSPARDFYVWSDDPKKYRDARIIFKDFETSNWTWDSVAKSYFWHRFYSHQPDLNFENPAVHEAMFRVIDFWFELGVDGLRLDAVPYLYEREGTNCENLPETHDFLRRLRAHIDAKFADRMLLAEANQWPEDAAAYFGQGDECHMEFNFPLMPRMFMAIQMEDRFPIIDILEQTPAIPEACQWAIFLRNHDELTLEMVTDEERDYMYRVYAQDPRARINLGIRRRLAPLLGNNRRKIELINSLLFSLPGTPIIYYGDEIGMGDNFFLGDRNGVRTPMQWSPDRNAGFSRANPHQLYLPAIIDPEYHFEAVNVESEQRNPSSLFWWMRRLIAVNRRSQALTRGSIEFLHPGNHKVLAFLRRHEGEIVLVVANLSRFSQAVELDLSAFADHRPIELFGRSPFPRVKSDPFALTLGPHAFFWLALEPAENPAVATGGPLTLAATEALGPRGDRLLEEEVLPAFLQSQSWFPWRQRGLRDVYIVDEIPVGDARLLVLSLTFVEGFPELLLQPVVVTAPDPLTPIETGQSSAVIARLDDGRSLIDAFYDERFRFALLSLLANGGALHGRTFRLTGHPKEKLDPSPAQLTASRPWNSQGASFAANFGDQWFLKCLRHFETGIQPDAEMLRHLGESDRFQKAPEFAGTLQITGDHGTGTFATLSRFVPNGGTAWVYTLDAIERFFERVLTTRVSVDNPEAVEETISGMYRERSILAGEAVAALHRTLAESTDDPGFQPEPFGTLYQRSLYQSMRGNLGRMLRKLRALPTTFSPESREIAERVIVARDLVMARYARLLAQKMAAAKIRVHGNLTLHSLINTGKDWSFVDFEGGTEGSVGERRLKRSALVDVAALLRSIEEAMQLSLEHQRAEDVDALRPWANRWLELLGRAFLSGYRRGASGAAFVPTNAADFDMLLDVLLLDDAVKDISKATDTSSDAVLAAGHSLLRLLEMPYRDESPDGPLLDTRRP